ncbi:hypothetical protein ACFVX6_06585 [Streptomyces sp. NPDC058289]|uniref:hypothetical protein n=1 Tax=Streptomyces sp. NPDC058289 TaxID=3346425 RepID=UPI0036F00CA5
MDGIVLLKEEAAPDTKDHVLESIEEHHVVLWMFSELRDLDAADERFDAKMNVLMENARRHGRGVAGQARGI